MLTTLKNAFKIKEIRQKILFTLGMLVVIRIGSQLPVSEFFLKFRKFGKTCNDFDFG